jgi:chromate transporter
MRDDLPLALFLLFVPFSLVSIGGGASVIAGIQHQVVDVQHWVTAREFVDLFALSRAAPGPGTMLATALGWHIAGWSGALLATLGFFVPSSLLCFGVVRVWNRHRGKRWHAALEQGLAPVGSGLFLAGVVSILRVGGGGMLSWGLALGSAGLLAWRPKLHPLLLFAAGAVLFIAARACFGPPA